MRRIIVLFMLFGATAGFVFGKVVLRGQVTLNSKMGQGLPGVSIRVPGENKFSSGSDGYFEKVLLDKEPGDVVTLMVHLDGKDIVNGEVLEVTFQKTTATDVHIVMCNTGERDLWAAAYYELQLTELINRQSDQRTAALRKLYKKDLLRLREELEKVKEEKETALKQAQEFAKKLAAVKLEEISGLYKEAVRLVRLGQLEEAWNVLDDARLDAMGRKAKKKLRQTVESYLLKADIAVTTFRFNEADTYFRKAIDFDTGYFKSIALYASYLYNQNLFDAALPWYRRAIALAEDDDEKCAALNDVGNLYSKNRRFIDAEKSYQESLATYRKLAAANPGAYLPDVAMTLNNLGLLKFSLQKYSDALEYFGEALKLREKMAAENAPAYDIVLCQTLIPLSLVHILNSAQSPPNQSLEKAAVMLTRAVSILEKYPDVPQAQNLLKSLKKLIEK